MAMIDAAYCIGGAVLGFLMGKAFQYLQGWNRENARSLVRWFVYFGALGLAFVAASFIGETRRLGVADGSLGVAVVLFISCFLVAAGAFRRWFGS
jgi:small-conductance mechanosensitive channel